MSTILRFPRFILALSLVTLWLAIRLGAFLAIRLRPVHDDERDDLNLVVGASLTMLALIIGFTFSMAVTRYDQRKNYEEEEANAIGTEYARADLLSASDAARVRQLLKQYLDQRLLFYTAVDSQQFESADRETAQLQSEMWSTVQAVAKTQPSPTVALVVAGMNDVLNRQGYTQAAWWNRIPVGAWSLMAVLAICCCLLTGYGARRPGPVLYTVLPFLVSAAFFLIADIDSPRSGVIHVLPENLLTLQHSLRSR